MKTLPLMAVTAAVLLSGCDRTPNVRDICLDNPALCADLNTSGWCRHDRAAIVHARYQYQTTGDDAHRFNELIKLEQYVDCMSHINQMVSRTPGKSLEQDRSVFYLKGLAALDALQKATEDAAYPGLSLYHWARFNDSEALDRFLEAEAEGQVQDPFLMRLAGLYFSNINPEKAKHYLLNVVEADPQAARDDQELLSQLGFVLNELGQAKAAFLFTYLGQKQEPQTDPSALVRHFGLAPQQADELVTRAKELDTAMKRGKPLRDEFNL